MMSLICRKKRWRYRKRNATSLPLSAITESSMTSVALHKSLILTLKSWAAPNQRKVKQKVTFQKRTEARAVSALRGKMTRHRWWSGGKRNKKRSNLRNNWKWLIQNLVNHAGSACGVLKLDHRYDSSVGARDGCCVLQQKAVHFVGVNHRYDSSNRAHRGRLPSQKGTSWYFCCFSTWTKFQSKSFEFSS